MGSYDEAETCELLTYYLLSQLNETPGVEMGLNRDDGRGVLQQTPKKTENQRENKERNVQIIQRVRTENHHRS